MKCKNHIEIDAIARCIGCQETFCENCLVEVEGKNYCADCKMMAVHEKPVFEDIRYTMSCAEASKALKFAIVGIFCIGFIVGPYAIVLGRSALKQCKDDPDLTGEGKAVAAIILGTLEFIFWIFWLIFKIAIRK